VKTVSDKVAFIGISIGAKMVGVGRPLLRENLAETDSPLQKRRLVSSSASAATPSEKSSINTNRKCSMNFSMSLRWTAYVAP